MTKKDKQFLYGKGHICLYCTYGDRSYGRSCVPLANVKNYTEIKQGITSFVIQVFDCDSFKRGN